MFGIGLSELLILMAVLGLFAAGVCCLVVVLRFIAKKK